MQSVNARTQSARRLAAAVLITVGLTGPLTACGGSQPSASHAGIMAAGSGRPTASEGPQSSAAPQSTQSPRSSMPLQTTPQSPRITTSPQATLTPKSGRTPGEPKRSQAASHTPALPYTPPAGTSQHLPEGQLTVADAARITVGISGLPASPLLVSGSAPVEFTVTMRNTGDTDFPFIAPVVRFDQYDGGLAPLGSVGGHLERFDPATDAWQAAPLPQASGMDFLLAATGGAPLPRSAVTKIRYRVTLGGDLRAGVTELQVYAVSQPSNQQAGMAATTVTIAP
ncbi:hypothetical protein ACWFR1_18965 [Streptomyces sp. NPDC055103]